MADDVRMRGFARRIAVTEALERLDGRVARLAEEDVAVVDAAGRVLAAPVVSEVDVPRFARAMMDGLAVRAEDTHGATAYNRIAMSIRGNVRPGCGWAGTLEPGQAVCIMTGAPLPSGADAVLPAELAEIGASQAWAQGEVSPGKHVGQVGEDVTAGETVLAAGRVLRPQDIGLLASIGVGTISVVRRPRVAIVVTGSELLPAGSRPEEEKIVDSNGPMLAALACRDGASTEPSTIVPDRVEAIREALGRPADVLLVSGGSSVGQEDYAPGLLAEEGELVVHGVAMRPSGPTGFGTIDGRLVFLLPGNPVSCLCAYDFFAGRAIRLLGGRPAGWPYRQVRAPLGRKVVSAVGRLDYLRVRLIDGQVKPLAIGGASVLSSTVRADGFVLVPDDSEGYPEGTEVGVYLYD